MASSSGPMLKFFLWHAHRPECINNGGIHPSVLPRCPPNLRFSVRRPTPGVPGMETFESWLHSVCDNRSAQEPKIRRALVLKFKPNYLGKTKEELRAGYLACWARWRVDRRRKLRADADADADAENVFKDHCALLTPILKAKLLCIESQRRPRAPRESASPTTHPGGVGADADVDNEAGDCGIDCLAYLFNEDGCPHGDNCVYVHSVAERRRMHPVLSLSLSSSLFLSLSLLAS